jgi:SAM-dependent methyltransferase/methyltransferase-like protein
MDELLQSYEEVPYPSAAFPEMHPDSLATAAHLCGMAPPAVESCRYLEIGSGVGSNLVAMAAALPGSRFVGVDLSPVQTKIARELAAGMQLDNLELIAGDIAEVGASLGQFDYIGAHGVYSWCPPAVQDAILSLCATQLAPQGVAYLSYNVLPGWHDEEPWRDILRFGAATGATWREKVAEARRFLAGVAAEAGERPWAAKLNKGVQETSVASDAYVLHEYLELYNQAFLFSEMAARAAEKGLQYLGESGSQPNLAGLPPPARKWLTETRPGRIELEQALDFFRNTAFRRSLFCRRSVQLSPPEPARVPGLWLVAQCTPISQQPEVLSDKPEAFRTASGQLSTPRPLIKAVLVALASVLPRALSFAALAADVRRRLEAADDPELSDELIAAAVLNCHATNLLELRLWAPRFTSLAGEKPMASALARLQIARNLSSDSGKRLPVMNLRHRQVTLDPFEEAVLEKLDGTRDRAALAEELVRDLSAKRFVLENDGRPVSSVEEMAEVLEAALASLASQALLNA